MKGSDITLIIHRLSMLNSYLERSKEKVEKDIKHWEEEIKLFGEDKKIGSMTYKTILGMVTDHLVHLVEEIKENNRIIEMLWDTLEAKDKGDMYG